MEDWKGLKPLMVVVVIGNALTAMLGLALFSVAIWVAVDGYKLYPLAAETGKEDIFAAAWIAIFTGFALFSTAVFGIFAAIKKTRYWIILYLVLMLIIYIFECASAITAATHRDYLVGNSNLMKKQMLMYYADESNAGTQVTNTWNRVMREIECCGTDGPQDWIDYTSTFRNKFGSTYPWPLNCCKRLSNFEVANPEGCKIGLDTAMFAKGCFGHIESVFSRYTWAISWFGFSILMFVFFVMLLTMVYYVKL